MKVLSVECKNNSQAVALAGNLKGSYLAKNVITEQNFVLLEYANRTKLCTMRYVYRKAKQLAIKLPREFGQAGCAIKYNRACARKALMVKTEQEMREKQQEEQRKLDQQRCEELEEKTRLPEKRLETSYEHTLINEAALEPQPIHTESQTNKPLTKVTLSNKSAAKANLRVVFRDLTLKQRLIALIKGEITVGK